jgi:hypothetical protein
MNSVSQKLKGQGKTSHGNVSIALRDIDEMTNRGRVDSQESILPRQTLSRDEIASDGGSGVTKSLGG